MAKTRALKFFLTVQSDIDDSNVQSSIVTLINNGSQLTTNDYAKLYSKEDLGNYSISIVGDQAILEFFPVDGKINDYSYGYVYYDTKKFITESSSFDVSDSVSIASSNTVVSAGTTGTIVILPEKFSSSKVVLEISGDDESFEFNEINLTEDKDGNLFFAEYGRLNINSNSLTGIGTYYTYKEGNNIKIDFSPFDTSQNYTCNAVSVSLAKTEYSASGQKQLKFANLSSNKVSFASTDSPVITKIIEHTLEYQSAYYLIQVNDLTNNRIDFSELFTANNLTQSLGVQYGRIVSDINLGEFEINTSGTFEVFFTPIPNADLEVLIFQQTLGFTPFSNAPKVINLKNSQIVTSVSKVGINDENNNRTNFNLEHKNLPIFERAFDGSDPFNVRLQENSIYLPNHFFVTGEKVLYRSEEFNRTSNVNSIGIAATFVSGIGITNKLPPEAYIYKFDNSRVGLCSSPEYALLTPPILFDFVSLGTGVDHYITATNQNSKCLIAIDNVIQSPIVGLSVTSNIISDIKVTDNILVFSGISSFFGGDLIKINDEIMSIESVGVGSTGYVGVRRSLLGTGISSHFSGDLVRKMKGNYNIVDNVIHFSEAPYGPFPAEDEFKDSESISLETLSKSKFQGRTFIRSADPFVLEDTYNRNYVFDDISEDFNSLQKTFELKQSFSSLVGVSNNIPLVLINNILQIPTEDFNVEEVGPKTEIEFTGTATSISYDPNNASIPRGGIILSIGSSSGFGYQPLISAGGTVTVSSAGTIQSISIGNSGSGYRRDYQLVRVGVQTFDSFLANIQFIGTATVQNGSIVGVSITNPGIGYTSYPKIYTTKTNNLVSSGSTIIFLEDLSKIPISNGIIEINSILNNVPIVGIGSTFVLVSTANSPSSTISANTLVEIKEYDPPKVIFDEPLSYSDIPLVYSGATGVGTEATIDVIVGQGSSVIDFKIKNFGYNYKLNDSLTLPISGPIGIPTTSSYQKFILNVVKTYNDAFSSWSVGSLRLLDDISYLINNKKRTFPLMYQGNRFSITSKPGSNIDIQSTLLVFINEVLQEPGVGYIFNGGSTITFSEPLKRYVNGDSDKVKLIFYRGTEGIDVLDVDILETVKPGDVIKLDSETYSNQQDERQVEDILSVDIARTNVYKGRGISEDSQLLRPINWTRQKNDLFIDGTKVTKDRTIYEPLVFPTTGIIKTVGIGSTQIFVQNVKTFFDNKKENNNTPLKNTIQIISLDNLVSASATATINSNGEVSSINIVNSGNGYLQAPKVVIQNPIGIGSTAIVTSNISNKKVTSFNITGIGSGYSTTKPPLVLIEPPTPQTEIISAVTYKGDFGIITGIATTSITGVAQTGLIFDLLIEKDSFLRDSTFVDVPILTSNIKQNYYFEVNNSNIGNGLESLSSNGSTIGIGTTALDNVYEVMSVSIAQTSAYGIGITDVAKVVVSVKDYNGISGLGFSGYYGNYNWGLIEFTSNRRVAPKQFDVGSNYGVTGLNTSPTVRRRAPLKYFNYLT
jgi:hypothetical protein